MLVNLSNHPSYEWSEYQLSIAKQYWGEVVDVSFPHVSANATSDEIISLAKKIIDEVDEYNPSGLHVMGELTLTFAIVAEAMERGITCVASTSPRKVRAGKNGDLIRDFEFVQFRSYKHPGIKPAEAI